jgi:hypothetical protein
LTQLKWIAQVILTSSLGLVLILMGWNTLKKGFKVHAKENAAQEAAARTGPTDNIGKRNEKT